MRSASSSILLCFFLCIVAIYDALGSAAAYAQTTQTTQTTIVLHATPVRGSNSAAFCDDPGVCDGVEPRTRVDSQEPHYIKVLTRNFDTDISGISCAFEWDPTWTWGFGIYHCPDPGGPGPPTSPGEPGGPIYGAYTWIFDCIEAGSTIILGTLVVNPGTSGCLRIIESAYPCGLCAFTCDTYVEGVEIDAQNVGRVCIGQDGHAPCEPATVPISAVSWGHIRAQFGTARRPQ